MSRDQQKIASMRAGGKILAEVRDTLLSQVDAGMSFATVEDMACELIAHHKGAEPSFKRVPKYHWATCVMKNDEVCHGIPRNDKVIEEGDLITIDVGVYYQGYHTDTSATTYIGNPPAHIQAFLAAGERSVEKAIEQAVVGKSVWHVSYAMQRAIETAGYHCVTELTGHGVGRELHEEPSIPCVADPTDKRIVWKAGQTVAIEVMYAMGDARLHFDDDGWTCRTRDRSLSGMHEHTVLITEHGPEILTIV